MNCIDRDRLARYATLVDLGSMGASAEHLSKEWQSVGEHVCKCDECTAAFLELTAQLAVVKLSIRSVTTTPVEGSVIAARTVITVPVKRRLTMLAPSMGIAAIVIIIAAVMFVRTDSRPRPRVIHRPPPAIAPTSTRGISEETGWDVEPSHLANQYVLPDCLNQLQLTVSRHSGWSLPTNLRISAFRLVVYGRFAEPSVYSTMASPTDGCPDALRFAKCASTMFERNDATSTGAPSLALAYDARIELASAQAAQAFMLEADGTRPPASSFSLTSALVGEGWPIGRTEPIVGSIVLGVGSAEDSRGLLSANPSELAVSFMADPVSLFLNGEQSGYWYSHGKPLINGKRVRSGPKPDSNAEDDFVFDFDPRADADFNARAGKAETFIQSIPAPGWTALGALGCICVVRRRRK